MGLEVGQKNDKKCFFRTGLPEVLGRYLGAIVEFYRSVWTVEKPEVSKNSNCMIKLSSCTAAWSVWTVMGQRLVKKMTNVFFSEPGCQKYRGG